MINEKISDNDAIQMAMIALESLHEDTYRHCVHAAKVAVQIASRIASVLSLGISEMRDVALLHDIGKLEVSPQILEKKEALTAREMENIYHHPLWGEQILQSMSDPQMRRYALYVRQHHETHDGSGYPSKLTLDEIDPVSRVLNIADRYAALTENRAYRKALLPVVAIESLRDDITAFFTEESDKVIEALASLDTESALPPWYNSAITRREPQSVPVCFGNLTLAG